MPGERYVEVLRWIGSHELSVNRLSLGTGRFMIRPLTQQDLPELAELRTRPGATDEQRQRAHAALTEMYPALFFNTPFFNADLRSLVSTDSDGKLTGVMAMGARPLQFHGQSITAAISSDLFVAEESRSSMAGVALLKGLLDGPQDITICDVANASTRRLWERLGGFIASAYNLNWIGVLRPSQLAAGMLGERRGLRLAGSALTTVAPLFDRAMPDRVKCQVNPVGRGLVESELTPDEFAEHLPELISHEAVQPVYSKEAAEWMWQRLPYLSEESGEVSTVKLHNSRGKLLGWYLYKLDTTGVARVSQIAAQPANAAVVVNHLLSRAYEQGAAAVAGRIQPSLQQVLIDHQCVIRGRETYALVHARNPQLADAYRGGQAWLSILDGEATLNAWNDPVQAAADLNFLQLPDRMQGQTSAVHA